MDKKTLAALKKSIKKWELISKNKGPELGRKNCALCRLFNYFGMADRECLGCPVSKITGQRYCGGTPYVSFDAHRGRCAWCSAPKNSTKHYSCETGLKIAVRELEFLKSLLPKKEVKS